MVRVKEDEFSKLEYDGWQRVAGQYFTTWANLTQQFIEPLLLAANVSKGQKVLDVACGPGIVSERIRAMNAFPIGIDFSPEMIRLARLTYPHIEFFEGDAEDLPFENDSFDAVVINFGMLHFPNPLLAMKEAYRSLRKNGWLAFTVWASPAKSPASKIMYEAKEKFADMSVPMPAAPAYDYFENPENCRSFLSEAGFDPRTLYYATNLVIWHVPTAIFLFEAELNAGVRNAAFLKQQSPETLTKIKTAVEQGMEPFKANNGYDLPFLGCIIAAKK